jgi:hypothetical protein
MRVLPDRSIVGFGYVDYIGNAAKTSAAGVFRLTQRGTPYRAFGNRGHRLITFFDRAQRPLQWLACAMTMDPLGRLTITGSGLNNALLTARLTRSGNPDRSFGPGRSGQVVTPGIAGGIPPCGAAASTPAGRVTAGVGNYLVQLLPNGRPNGRVGRGGVFRIGRPSGVAIQAVLQPRVGRIVVAGYVGNADALYIARYLVPTSA